MLVIIWIYRTWKSGELVIQSCVWRRGKNRVFKILYNIPCVHKIGLKIFTYAFLLCERKTGRLVNDRTDKGHCNHFPKIYFRSPTHRYVQKLPRLRNINFHNKFKNIMLKKIYFWTVPTKNPSVTRGSASQYGVFWKSKAIFAVFDRTLN